MAHPITIETLEEEFDITITIEQNVTFITPTESVLLARGIENVDRIKAWVNGEKYFFELGKQYLWEGGIEFQNITDGTILLPV